MSVVRKCGLAVAVGAIAWAIAGLVAGPIEEAANSRIELMGSFAFQIGVLALVGALWVTEGTGSGRWGRAVLVVEAVLVVLGMGWTIPHLFDPNLAGEGIMLALDAAWPLSMLWLIVLGVRVARARRWPGGLRWMPLVASLWFPVSIIAVGAGEWPALVISSVWLGATYVAMGLLMAARAEAVAGVSTSDARRSERNLTRHV
jgi:hypothetical protein